MTSSFFSGFSFYDTIRRQAQIPALTGARRPMSARFYSALSIFIFSAALAACSGGADSASPAQPSTSTPTSTTLGESDSPAPLANSPVEILALANANSESLADVCATNNLPSETEAGLSSSSGSCPTTAVAVAAVSQDEPIATASATIATEHSDDVATVTTLNEQAAPLSPEQLSVETAAAPPRQLPVEIAGAVATENGVAEISSVEQTQVPESCVFVDESQTSETRVSSAPSGQASLTESDDCRATSAPTQGAAGAEEARIDASVSSRAQSESFIMDTSDPNEHGGYTKKNKLVSSSPNLVDVPEIAETIDGITFPGSLIVENARGGADIVKCVFIDDSRGTQEDSLDGLYITVIVEGRACMITGTLTGVGQKSYTVRALSLLSHDETIVIFNVIPDATIGVVTPETPEIPETPETTVDIVSVVNVVTPGKPETPPETPETTVDIVSVVSVVTPGKPETPPETPETPETTVDLASVVNVVTPGEPETPTGTPEATVETVGGASVVTTGKPETTPEIPETPETT
ncbi:MAG: hypothetical protein K8963_02670, partial [Proteobacteria bacterium]|nr:hypothetical protein [Pseudomonadota bacterium]